MFYAIKYKITKNLYDPHENEYREVVETYHRTIESQSMQNAVSKFYQSYKNNHYQPIIESITPEYA